MPHLAVGIATGVALGIVGCDRPAPRAATRDDSRTRYEQPATVANIPERAHARLMEINRRRAEHGRRALRWSACASRAALEHSRRMAEAQSMSHQLPGEPAFDVRLRSAGCDFGVARENVGFGPDLLRLSTALWASPLHHANLVAADVTAVGIAIVDVGDTHYMTHNFVGAASSSR